MKVHPGLVALAVVLASMTVRAGVLQVPAVADRLPGNVYLRAIHYQQAAEQLARGEGVHINLDQRQRLEARWVAEGHRIPPDIAGFPALPEDRRIAFYDERGHLLFVRAIGMVMGRHSHHDVLLTQMAISSVLNGLLAAAAWSRLPLAAAAGVAVACVFQPLEMVLSATPDLPVWAVWATMAVVAAVLARPGSDSRLWPLVAAAGAGAVAGLAVVARGPSIAIVVLGAIALWMAGGRRGFWSAALFFLVAVTFAAWPGLAPLGIPSVGRSEFWHTLLAGLSEFGHIPGLQWDDGKLDAYMNERYQVVLGNPGYSEAARLEVLRLVSERPWLPVQVALTRAGWFLYALRPGRDSLPWVVALGFIKIGALFAWIWWLRDVENRRVALAVLLVVCATLLAHVAIVPLLEVYVAPALIGGTTATVAALFVLSSNLFSRVRRAYGG